MSRSHRLSAAGFAKTAALLIATALIASPSALTAATIDLFPGQSFEAAVESLNPGDTLIVHQGTYSDAGRISITVQGTQQSPVTIRGADGEAPPLITRAASAPVQNTINIEGASHLRITGLEISSNEGDALNLSGNPSFITLDNLELHDVDVGINFRSNMHHITVQRNHIHHTGGGGGGTGEGMYVGCNDATCVVSDSLIENNWIHDTRNSTQGDGIEVKIGSHTIVVRDNVIHDTGFPCILLYGTNGNPVNVVEGNVMWNCGDSALQTAADAVIRNNIIFGDGVNGFNSQSHQGAVPGNLQFVHNTVIGGSPCLRLSGWNLRPGLVLANNAIYCDSDNFVIGGLSGVTVSGNVMSPATSALPSAGYVVGQTTALDFLDVTNHNVYPRQGSRLVDAGNASHVTTVDFNGNVRSGVPDAGAYNWSVAQNPGWVVRSGFKSVTAVPSPVITLTANPQSVAEQGSSTLTWSTTDADSCSASADPTFSGWSGSKATSGTQSVGPLAATTSFTLACTNSGGGSASRSMTVTVASSTPAPTLTFNANPTTVTTGQRSTLTWSTTNATGCTASGAWAGNKAPSGTEQTAVLNSTSTFALGCTGGGGSVQRSATVTVNAGTPAPPTVSLSADPATVNVNGSAMLSWSSTNATTCTATGGWTGSKATSGSESTGALSNTASYTLQCTGGGGSASQSATVTVNAGGGGGGGGTPGTDSGGGSFGLLTLFGLLGLLGAAHRRV